LYFKRVFHASYLNSFESEEGATYESRGLRDLNVSYSNISSTTLENFDCPELEKLNLSSCRDISECQRITETGFNHIMRYLNQLTEADIWVTGKTLDTIAKHAKNLRYVHIRNCLKLREKDIRTQQKKFPNTKIYQ
tara:strand:+ start:62 stop:469 length:408 start_codon:yes stop_codon:yes gene_type:complete